MASRPIEEMRADSEALLTNARQERDEGQLKMYLAKAEARDEWADREPRWEHCRATARAVGYTAGAASADVGGALGLLADELRNGHARIRKSMKWWSANGGIAQGRLPPRTVLRKCDAGARSGLRRCAGRRVR